MSIEVKVFDSAEELPPEWDALTRGNVFLERASLSIVERSNPCSQQYVLISNGSPDSIFATYRRDLDLLAFTKGRMTTPVTVVGVACSVSAPGFSFGAKTSGRASELISGIDGASLVLNAMSQTELKGLATGKTLPSCELELAWEDFDHYLSSMRSHYRYEMLKTLKLGSALTVRCLPDNKEYGDELHQLYLNVYEKSDYKLERLAPDFLREFPGEIYVFSLADKEVGFVKAFETGKRLTFLFGGLDYDFNVEYRVYLNMLRFLVKEGIRRKCEVIDFGQTAEDVKLKMGCRYSERYVYAGHSRAALKWGLKACAGFLSYKPPEDNYHVFKS